MDSPFRKSRSIWGVLPDGVQTRETTIRPAGDQGMPPAACFRLRIGASRSETIATRKTETAPM